MLNNTSHQRSKSIWVKFGVGMVNSSDSCGVEGKEKGTTVSSNGHVLLALMIRMLCLGKIPCKAKKVCR